MQLFNNNVNFNQKNKKNKKIKIKRIKNQLKRIIP